MTIDEKYAESQAPGPGPTDLIRLAPFTVGHYHVLSRLQSRLLTKPAAMKNGDVALALFVLRRRWDRAQKLIGSRWMTFSIKLNAEWFKANPAAFDNAFAGLLIHWSHHTKSMKVWEGESSGTQFPLVHSIKRVLMGELGYSLSKCMNTPVKGALADLVCFSSGASEGGLITDREREVMERRRAIRAQNRKVSSVRCTSHN